MKIIYLDFDGVLHDAQVFFHPQRGMYIETPGRRLFEWAPILEGLLEPFPDVKIVLSTSWVRAKSFSYAKSHLSESLQQRVLGATFHRRLMRKEWFENLPRGEQIAQDVYRRGPTAWFAIDDDVRYWPEWCRDNLIQTNGAFGISDPKIQHAIQVMLQKF